MKNSKLIELLSTLTPMEYNELKKFSTSPFFNNGRKYYLLLKLLWKYYPEFNESKFTKQSLYKTLFPESKYNDQVMRNLMNGLLRLCENYLVLKQTISDKRDYYNILSDQMIKRKLFKLAEKNLNKSLEIIEKTGIDSQYYKKLYEHEQIKRAFYNTNNDQKSSIEILQNASTCYFYYYILEVSSQLEEMIVLNHNWKAGFEYHLLYDVLKNLDMNSIIIFLKNNTYVNHEIIELYSYHIKQMINNKDEELFAKLIDLFRKYSHKLSRWGKYNMYLSLANACIKLQEVDDMKYTNELFMIYEEQLEEKLYSSGDEQNIEQDMFRNILINALKLRKFSWTEDFLKKHINKLNPEFRDNMLNYAYSNLCFERGEFENALKYITLVKFDTFAFKFDVRTLMLKIYYEMNYFDQAKSLIDSFKHFIQGNLTISEYIKSVHLNFIKFVNELIKIKENKKDIEIEKLRNEILASSVRSKDWLLEKI